MTFIIPNQGVAGDNGLNNMTSKEAFELLEVDFRSVLIDGTMLTSILSSSGI